jgi:tRNA 2-thiouridine synthesizing protein A
MNSDKILDAKGLACPMPIVKTKKVLHELESGQVLEIHATDKGAKNDLAAWAKSTGNELIKQRKKTKYLSFG